MVGGEVYHSLIIFLHIRISLFRQTYAFRLHFVRKKSDIIPYAWNRFQMIQHSFRSSTDQGEWNCPRANDAAYGPRLIYSKQIGNWNNNISTDSWSSAPGYSIQVNPILSIQWESAESKKKKLIIILIKTRLLFI